MDKLLRKPKKPKPRYSMCKIVLYTNSLPPPWPVSVNTNRNYFGIWYFGIGITVGIFDCDLAGTPFEDFAGTLFLKIWREFLLSLKGG